MNVKEFFQKMHDVDFPYVVLRNFEYLPEGLGSPGHGDLDILVYDLKHFQELFPSIRPCKPLPRVIHKANFEGLNAYIDVRHVGDGYYPKSFEMEILNDREYNESGFFTPNPYMFRLALVYHAVHHKNHNSYEKWIGNGQIEEYLEALKKSAVGYTVPDDHTVGKFNQYWKGATSVVSRKDGKVVKRQTGWTSYNLIDNEYRILSDVDSRHFPKVELEEKDIIIEDCGDRLRVDNVPQDWKHQLVEIIKDLRDNKIQHRDIKPDNLMVKDGVIKLIDFGWARFEDDDDDHPPEVLGFPYRPTSGYDDNFSMRKVMKEIEYKLEEQLV